MSDENVGGKLGDVSGKLRDIAGKLGDVSGKLGDVSGHSVLGRLGDVSGTAPAEELFNALIFDRESDARRYTVGRISRLESESVLIAAWLNARIVQQGIDTKALVDALEGKVDQADEQRSQRETLRQINDRLKAIEERLPPTSPNS